MDWFVLLVTVLGTQAAALVWARLILSVLVKATSVSASGERALATGEPRRRA